MTAEKDKCKGKNKREKWTASPLPLSIHAPIPHVTPILPPPLRARTASSRGTARTRTGTDSIRGRKGFSMVYDAALACLILFVGMALAVSLVPYAPQKPVPDLQSYATTLLAWMDSKGVLAPCVYAQDSARLSSALDSLAPAGYCVKVYAPQPGSWDLLWTCTSPKFDAGNAAASQPYRLSGYMGSPDQRVVVLLLSPP